MSNIGRGTTPTNKFNVSMDLTEATVLYITYSQLGKTVIEKTLEDVTEITAESVSVKLTQEDTLSLKASSQVEIQIRAGFGGENGDRVRSNIMVADVERILKDGEI